MTAIARLMPSAPAFLLTGRRLPTTSPVSTGRLFARLSHPRPAKRPRLAATSVCKTSVRQLCGCSRVARVLVVRRAAFYYYDGHATEKQRHAQKRGNALVEREPVYFLCKRGGGRLG